jgi:HAD superfamily hydrolase (TIGR01509 family)
MHEAALACCKLTRVTNGGQPTPRKSLCLAGKALERHNRAMKKILIFDLFDMLIEGFSHFTAVLSTRLNLATSDVIAGLGGEPLVALTEGRISEATYWQCVLERTHWPITVQELRAGVRHTFRKAMPGMPELLTSLRRHRLVLFSDQAREWWEDIEATHAFIQVFDQRFLSFDLGQTKRHVGTFQRVLAELGAVPHHCVFIDDLSWNIERAESVGLCSHRFTSTAALTAFLAQEGIYAPAAEAS